MIRVFGHAKTPKNKQEDTVKHPQNTLLEQALNFEKQRNQDLQNRLQMQEKQIFELLATIKDLSQSVKRLEPPQTDNAPRKRFLGIF